MKTLYLDCGMGAAGDMLAAALLELLPDRDAALSEWNSLGIPDVKIQKTVVQKCGITGTHISVTVNGQEEESLDFSAYDHDHEHDHEHGHDHEHSHEHSHDGEHAHHHSGMHEIEHIIESLRLSPKVQSDVLAVYGLIAEAESHVHGVPVTDIHFHEVGTMDAIADIAAVCLLMDKLAPQQVVVSPIHVGSGHVKCAHGILPVPAPATAYILRDVPIYGGGLKGELCTPTGAALLKHFATRFGEMPVMRVQTIGYGMGKKDFEAANCVRALLGETEECGDTVAKLSCNLDDMTAEDIGFAMERFFEAGALEVYTVPVGMKKSRPGVLLCVMCRESEKDNLVRLMFRHTTTLGVREDISRRYTLERSVVTLETSAGPVHQKLSQGYETTRAKYEFEDLAKIAREKGLSLAEVKKMIEG
jgi:hypothetical protein